MNNRLSKLFLFSLLFVTGLLITFNFVFAKTLNNSVIFNFSFPSNSSGGGGGSNPPPQDTNDTTPPTISGVVVKVNNDLTVNFDFNITDNVAVSGATLYYGLSTSYGKETSAIWNGSGSSYWAFIENLATDTTYYFKISALDTNNNKKDYTASFKTPKISQQNEGPTDLTVTPGVNSALITFLTDIPILAQIDYGLTTALGSTAIGSASPATNHSINILGLQPNTKYFYRLFGTDPQSGDSGSTTISSFNTLPDTTPPPDVTTVNLTESANFLSLSWKNPSLSFTPDFVGVKILRKIGSSVTGISDQAAVEAYKGSAQSFNDTNVVKDKTYYYTIFSYDQSDNFSGGVSVSGKLSNIKNEICNNGIDDDQNGKIDCADSACLANSFCQVEESTSTTSTVVKGNEEAVEGSSSTSSNLPDFQRLKLDKVKFFGGSRQIELSKNDGQVYGLPLSALSVAVRQSDLASPPTSFYVAVGKEKHNFVFDSSNNTYYSDLTFSGDRYIEAELVVNYEGGSFDSLKFYLNTLSFGRVYDGDGLVQSGAEVKLFLEDGTLFNASVFGQSNPTVTEVSGVYGWVVPNGSYYITVKKDKFFDFKGPLVVVKNNVFNDSSELVSVPLDIKDVIDKDASVVENTANVAKNLAEKTSVVAALTTQQVKNVVATVNNFTSDPEVKKVAGTVVAPTAVGVAAVGTAALVSWADILPLLRFLFLQPVLLFGRGKREKWGTVYNSLSKIPVDLAMVRLINADTNRLVQTKVTSSDGRYFFVINPGNYRIEIRKEKYSFPSSFLKGMNTDGQRLDIYHGEVIKVTESGAVITANIPLDPVSETAKKPLRLVFSKIMHRVQAAVSVIGLLVTAVSLYISPTWYMWVLLGVHIFLGLAFKRLTRPVASKGWGIVYDQTTKKPLGRVVARLFDYKFNKLISTEITDADGKYYFMAGDNKYYLSFERLGYEPVKTEPIDLTGKSPQAIAKDVELKKQS
jgi:hypothetical protein